jgi:hypothetical protein
MIDGYPELGMKLQEALAETLGASRREALKVAFDLALAKSSLRFFDLREIPAIRGELPAGIGDVHFRSDLSGFATASVDELCKRCPALTDLLPDS